MREVGFVFGHEKHISNPANSQPRIGRERDVLFHHTPNGWQVIKAEPRHALGRAKLIFKRRRPIGNIARTKTDNQIALFKIDFQISR